MTGRGHYEERSDEATIDHFSQVAYTVHPLNSHAWDGIYIVGKTAIGHTTVVPFRHACSIFVFLVTYPQ